MNASAARILLNFVCGASLACLASPLAAQDEEQRGTTLEYKSTGASDASADDAAVGEVATQKEPGAAKPAALAAEKTELTPVTSSQMIRERYPSGAIKIERQVVQDASSNYLNHGLWTQWNEQGRLVATGEYRNRKREGRWIRVYGANEGPMFKSTLYDGFVPPFASEAEFERGIIHGAWRTFDSQGRKMSEWTFENGKRTGKSTWWHPNGQKRRELEFVEDVMDGESLGWESDQELILREKFIAGRRLVEEVEFYSPGQKKSEQTILMARELLKTNYDWWAGNVTLTVVGKEGVDQKHGPYTSWHKNGQKRMEATYHANELAGRATWWFPNGQVQLEAEYLDGKPNGRFVWWHENGLKSIEGHYASGVQAGKWLRWNMDGNVTEVSDFADNGVKAVEPKNAVTKPEREVPFWLRSTAPTSIVPIPLRK